ncbi:MAG: glucose-6-phosphate isomerase [Neptuniibacter sp.]
MTLKASLAWKDLESHAYYVTQSHISTLFNENPNRFEDLNFSTGKLLADFSKQNISNETVKLLIALAKEKNLPQWIEDLFNGKKLNDSEDRPALHTALRTPENESLIIDGTDIISEVHKHLKQMEKLVSRIHSGQWRGFSGHPINTIVNIGVGGSDLGPLMACKALSQYSSDLAKPITVHFVSSMDGSQMAELLNQLNPAKTLFVVASKSFSTIDTLANANTAIEWLKKSCNEVEKDILLARHFVGVTANPSKAKEWGIPEGNQLEFWDWTGGRYSMWSTIGLPIALKLGMQRFSEILAGAHAMDLHFKETPLDQNIPVLLAMIGIWNINFLNISAHAILPYDGRLIHLPAYLEQLEMESNGKSVTRNGEITDYHTCPILWGEIGTNAQHAFYQLLHQGTEAVMCDFLVSAKRYHNLDNSELKHQHQLNLANCLAQSRILALGDSVLDGAEQNPTHKRYRGNQPCTTIMIDELTPFTFGQLIALYEHKVFVQSVIWDINPFDQWGVELGKKVATSLFNTLENDDVEQFDSSTNGLMHHIAKKSKV